MPSTAHVIPANFAHAVARVGPTGETLTGLIESALCSLELSLSPRVVGIYVEHHFNELAVARVAPVSAELPTDGFSLELRMASWLNGLTSSEIRSVPTFLLAWLPVSKVVAVPLLVEAKHRGAIVVEAAKLGRAELERVAWLAQRLSESLVDLARSSPQGPDSARLQFAQSVHRIKTATRP